MRMLTILTALGVLAGCATPAGRDGSSSRTASCFGRRGFYHCTTF